MQWFEVRQEQEDLWSVSSKGGTLYLYSSEEKARQAALMLASDDSKVVLLVVSHIIPPRNNLAKDPCDPRCNVTRSFNIS
jgi:hypothetical protein